MKADKIRYIKRRGRKERKKINETVEWKRGIEGGEKKGRGEKGRKKKNGEIEEM